MTTQNPLSQNLLVELFVEELPPKALNKLGNAFADVLLAQLQAQGLAAGADAATPSVVTAFASPRRLAAHVTAVAERAADKPQTLKLMPVAVGLTADGQATPALLKRLGGMGVDVSDPAAVVARLTRQPDGKAEALFLQTVVPGVALAEGLQKALNEALAKLPIPKVMSYQLQTGCDMPGWTSVSFVRPAHGLVALHGAHVVPVSALGLTAGRNTHGHRFEAAMDPVPLAHADGYAATLARDGAVIASYEARSRHMIRQLRAQAAGCGAVLEVERGMPPMTDAESENALLDNALVQEVTALVERPNVLVCQFEPEFLAVPQECLILTMKANQKYFPLLDAAGKLTNQFLVVSNISPLDASAVIGGNERVVRPRLADAKFFFDQDRKRTLASRVAGLGKVVYHNKLGTQGQRAERVRAMARAIATELAAQGWGGADLVAQADVAAQLAKTDLLTDMVGEFPELQGTMGAYYARHDGLGDTVAEAIEDHYKPRFAGDELPRNPVGVVVSLADKLETLVGMFGIGNLPTGDKDPFALRRHALGVVRMLVEKDLPIGVHELVSQALGHWLLAAQGQSVSTLAGVEEALPNFFYDRMSSALREQGFSAQAVDAVLALRPQRLAEVSRRLEAVRAFAALPEAPALAAANKRVANILKKVEGEVRAQIDPALLVEPAEDALADALLQAVPQADAAFAAGDYTASLQALAALRAPVDAFFDGVMVNADDPALKANRLGLLKILHLAMNRVADLGRLAA